MLIVQFLLNVICSDENYEIIQVSNKNGSRRVTSYKTGSFSKDISEGNKKGVAHVDVKNLEQEISFKDDKNFHNDDKSRIHTTKTSTSTSENVENGVKNTQTTNKHTVNVEEKNIYGQITIDPSLIEDTENLSEVIQELLKENKLVGDEVTISPNSSKRSSLESKTQKKIESGTYERFYHTNPKKRKSRHLQSNISRESLGSQASLSSGDSYVFETEIKPSGFITHENLQKSPNSRRGSGRNSYDEKSRFQQNGRTVHPIVYSSNNLNNCSPTAVNSIKDNLDKFNLEYNNNILAIKKKVIEGISLNQKDISLLFDFLDPVYKKKFEDTLRFFESLNSESKSISQEELTLFRKSIEKITSILNSVKDVNSDKKVGAELLETAIMTSNCKPSSNSERKKSSGSYSNEDKNSSIFTISEDELESRFFTNEDRKTKKEIIILFKKKIKKIKECVDTTVLEYLISNFKKQYNIDENITNDEFFQSLKENNLIEFLDNDFKTKRKEVYKIIEHSFNQVYSGNPNKINEDLAKSCEKKETIMEPEDPQDLNNILKVVSVKVKEFNDADQSSHLVEQNKNDSKEKHHPIRKQSSTDPYILERDENPSLNGHNETPIRTIYTTVIEEKKVNENLQTNPCTEEDLSVIIRSSTLTSPDYEVEEPKEKGFTHQKQENIRNTKYESSSNQIPIILHKKRVESSHKHEEFNFTIIQDNQDNENCIRNPHSQKPSDTLNQSEKSKVEKEKIAIVAQEESEEEEKKEIEVKNKLSEFNENHTIKHNENPKKESEKIPKPSEYNENLINEHLRKKKQECEVIPQSPEYKEEHIIEEHHQDPEKEIVVNPQFSEYKEKNISEHYQGPKKEEEVKLNSCISSEEESDTEDIKKYDLHDKKVIIIDRSEKETKEIVKENPSECQTVLKVDDKNGKKSMEINHKDEDLSQKNKKISGDDTCSSKNSTKDSETYEFDININVKFKVKDEIAYSNSADYHYDMNKSDGINKIAKLICHIDQELKTPETVTNEESKSYRIPVH